MTHRIALCVTVALLLIGQAFSLASTSEEKAPTMANRAFHAVYANGTVRSLCPMMMNHQHKNSLQSYVAKHEEVVAVSDYTKQMETTGWDNLRVSTNSNKSDETQAFAAGVAEGYATYEAVWMSWLNTFALTPNGSWIPKKEYMPASAVSFVQGNMDWVAENVKQKNKTDPYWFQVGLQMLQFDGLVAGYNQATAHATPSKKLTSTNGTPMPSPANLSAMEIMFLVMAGDLMDVFTALNIMTEDAAAPSMAEAFGDIKSNSLPKMLLGLAKKDWRNMNKQEFNEWFVKKTHCSALVKLKYDLSDIFVGHATWATYNMMYRIYKVYTLNYKSAEAKTVSFSSYPACLSSIDDFYITSQRLAVTETSFSVYNTSIYKGNVCPTCGVMYWVRSQVANRMATSSEEWITTFSRYNSGTYNNQWMVLDYNKFTPRQSLKPGTLWIAEQFPGRIESRDVTTDLTYGYWPSYNVPSIPSLFNYSGYPEAVKQQGWQMSGYEKNVRGEIFRRDQASVVDLKSFAHIMQYNDYKNDPISENDPVYSVASRGDLLTQMPQCFGAVDAKIVNYDLMVGTNNGADDDGVNVWAFSGPTPQQPLFDFATTKANIMCEPSFGMPRAWNFTFETMKPGN